MAKEKYRIEQSDCIDFMQSLAPQSIAFLFTDPPYGTTRCKWDTPLDLDAFWTAAHRVLRDDGCVALFAQTPFDKVLGCSNLKELRYEWIWEKNQATGHLNAKKMPMKAHENILVFYKRLPIYNPQITHGHTRKVSTAEHKRNCKSGDCYGSYLATSYDSTDRYPRSVIKGPTDKQSSCLHPTQKPVWLCETMVKTYTNPGDTVLDCCMGSGSIGEACLRTGRMYLGCDSNHEWYEVAEKRLNAVEKALLQEERP